MMTKGRSFKASAVSVDRSKRSSRATSRLAVGTTALLSVGLLALSGCSPNLEGLFGAGGASTASGGTGGTGGTGGMSTGGDTSTSSSTSSTTSSTSSTSSSTSSTTSSTSSTTSSTSSTTSSTSSGPVTVTALPEGSTYRYWDKGSVAAGWSGSGFDDNAWSTGTAPLGYGDAYVVTTVGFGPNAGSKYISTWFRTSFDVASAAAVTTATIELNVDDGALVFLNGAEWVRWNMPDGATTPDTLASGIVDGAQEGQFIGFDVDPSLLVSGKNVLAIELHQAVANSSDLGIDARVTLDLN